LQLNELDRIRKDAIQRTILVQNQWSKWHEKFIKKKLFQPGDWALLFDSRFKTFKGTLTTRWMGPYEVVIVFDNGSVRIKTIDDESISFLVNGPWLKVYQKPVSKKDFVKVLSEQEDMELVNREVSSPSPSSWICFIIFVYMYI